MKTLDEYMKNPRIRGIVLYLIDHDDPVSEIANYTRYNKKWVYQLVHKLRDRGILEEKEVIGERGKYKSYQTTHLGKIYLKAKGYRIEPIKKELREFLGNVHKQGGLNG